MKHFDYVRPTTVEQACALLADTAIHSVVVAGGTDLMVQLREKSKRWKDLERVIDLTAIPAMSAIVEEDGGLFIGALATHTQIEQSPLVAQYLPTLATACAQVGSPQIRNMGTIGGAICNASPASDPLPALVMCDAMVVITGGNGTRTCHICDVYDGNGNLTLTKGELVEGFRIAPLPQGCKTGFVKLGRRKALAISRLNAAVGLTLADDGTIATARIAPGCIFKAPKRVTTAEALLIGKVPSPELFAQAGAEVSAEMIRITGVRWSTEYKGPVVETVVSDALQVAMEG